MSKILYHTTLFALIKGSTNPLIDASFIEIDNNLDAVQKATELSINIEIVQNRLRLIPNSIQTKIFDSIDSFLSIKEITDNSNFLIIDNENAISFFDKTTFVNFERKENYLISNQQAFLEFLSILKQHEIETDDAFHFVDSYNKDLRKISFVSLSDKGRLTITYELKAPLFDPNRNLKKQLERFKACFDNENKSLLKFLKSATISIASNFPAEQRLQMLIESLDKVVERARINFEVYLNNLSIDKIRKDYDEVKSKYFNSLSDILSKLSNKIIALPIGISATLFAVDKIKDSCFFLLFLLGATVVTSIYICLLLRIHLKDLNYISKIFHYDYNTLLANNFFSKCPDEKNLFEEIKKRITERITFLKTIIESYYWIMNVANIVISIFILGKLGVIENRLILITIGLIFSIILFRNYILNNEEEQKSIA
ncbi:MAG: hypothetical protein RJA76_1808 [Bacteroidota bacterium]|jgi:hypothetical protein